MVTQSNILSKLMYLIYLLDYSTIYFAIKNKINPSPVSSIDFIKSKTSKELLKD
jgi:glucose/mannose-6-phosphate isomerase